METRIILLLILKKHGIFLLHFSMLLTLLQAAGPGSVEEFSCSWLNSRSFSLEWKDPLDQNGVIRYFILRYKQTGWKHNCSELFDDSVQEHIVSSRNFTLRQLNPSATYFLSLSAVTVKEGPPRNLSCNTIADDPVFDREPQFMSKTTDSITIKIFPALPTGGGHISAYFVVVQLVDFKTRMKRYAKDLYTPRDCLVMMDAENRYVAARIETVPDGGKVFTVGDGACIEGFHNRPLTRDSHYRIGIAALSRYHGKESYSFIKYMAETIDMEIPGDGTNAYGAVLGTLVFLIVLVCVLIFVLLFKNGLPWTKSTEKHTEESPIETASLSGNAKFKIPIKALEEYTLRSIADGEIKRQHRVAPAGLHFSFRSSRILENRLKNRYENLLPYDHSRVVLQALPTEPHSDYINANYVSGYKKDKKYIATQGPMRKTVTDFWRLVWGEKSCKILMATNLVEGGKIKCEKYWSDNTSTFGSVTVTLKHSEPLLDYTVRTFEITDGKEKREIKHFHFLTWPDHGVPMCTLPVVKFLKMARNYQPNNEAPIIVHCSAGVGRTGTLILLDTMLDMAASEGQVDVTGHLFLMRQQRSNFVENQEQYVFVYEALVQTLCWEETSILCSDLIPQIKKLRRPNPKVYFTPLEQQYQRLLKICPKLDRASVRVACQRENASKNRSMEILPPERARPIVKCSSGEGSTYINAVYINGYREKNSFVATQLPLPDTVADFWQMIQNSESRTIVLLQDVDFTNPRCPRYWPCEGQTTVYGELRIRCNSLEVESDLRVWSLSLTTLNSEDDHALAVTLLQNVNWPATKPLPEHPRSILNLIAKVQKMQTHCAKHTVTVQCLNGSTACGIFCAAVILCDRMINEQEVDAFLAVQTVRANRPQFIETFEQYDFLYNLAISFLDNFGT